MLSSLDRLPWIWLLLLAAWMAITPITPEPHLVEKLRLLVHGELVRSSTMFRGMEPILHGRDPREAWVFAQRVCGVCTKVHAIASVRAVENALGITIPDNARLVRNLIEAAQFVQDHVIHFYHLHALDWVDMVDALNADLTATSDLARSISTWPNSSPEYFASVRERLQGFTNSGQLGLFANGYWGHPAYQLPSEANLLAVAHYLEALDWQRQFIKIHAILGGKNPHPQTYLVGGTALPIHPTNLTALNLARLDILNNWSTRRGILSARCTCHPHYVEVKPSYMMKLKSADLFFLVGLDLELWAQQIVDGSRNSALAVVDLSRGVQKLDIPSRTLDASEGDVHRFGNPHYWLDPRNIPLIVESIVTSLSRVSPADEQYFRANAERYTRELNTRIAAWEKTLKPLAGKKVLTFHRSWTILQSGLGSWLPGRRNTGTGTARSASSARATVCRSTW